MSELTQKAKSYWSRPEGKTGMILLAGAAGAFLYFWGKIVPFLLSMLANTLMLGVAAVALIVFLLIVFSPRTHMMFRLLTRAITGMVINIDPIGILKDRVAQLSKRMESFSERKDSLAGAKRQVDNTIARNEDDIRKSQKVLANAKATLSKVTDPTQQLRVQTEGRIAANEVTRLELANKEYRSLSQTLGKISDVLERGEIYLDGFIRDGQNEARQWEIKRRTSGAAKSAISSALSILKGKASENDIYQSTLDHLADEYDTRLGMVDEGLKDLESFMTKVDLQTGVVDVDALAFVGEFEKKLALPAAVPQPQLSTATPREKEPVGGQVVDAEYSDYFKKKG